MQKVLKQGLALQTFNYTDDYPKKKITGLMKDESGGDSEDKKSKRHNKVCHKKSLNLKIMKTV